MSASHEHRVRRRLWWRALLVVPAVATLWVPWFAHLRPLLFGLPFFYWYLLAWVPGSALCTGIVYLATRDVM